MLPEIQSIEKFYFLKHIIFLKSFNSVFYMFYRKICERINEACCRKYSHHNTRTPDNRWDFQINDKICCTKNGYVQTYEEEHGIMIKKKKKSSTSNR